MKAIFYLVLLLTVFSCQQDAAETETDNTEAPSTTFADDYMAADYKWGFADANGKLVIPALYDEVRNFDENGLALVRRGGKWNFIEANNNQRSKAWIMAWEYAEGLARIRSENDSIGFIDTKGKIVIPPTFSDAGDFIDGHAWIRIGDQYGVIDRSGKMAIPAQYERLSGGQNGEYIFRANSKYGIVTATGIVLIPAEYDQLKPFGENDLTPARQNGRYGYLNRKNEWAISPGFIQAGSFQENRAVIVNEQEQFQLIDPEGKNYLREAYGQVWYGNEGTWLVEKDGLYGGIDAEGASKIPLVFNELQPASEGYLVYNQGRGWGHLRLSDAQPITPPVYALAWPFVNGFARVVSQRGMSLIDTTGQLRFPPLYLDLRDGSRGLFPVQVIE